MDNRIVLFLVIAMFATACGKTKNERKFGDRLNIVTTTGMIEDALKNIVKDSADVSALMGPGVDPHLYKATQGDLNKLTGADAIFYNGLQLEGKMSEVLSKLSVRKPVVAVAHKIDSSKLKSAPDYNYAIDPHIWFDVSLWIEAVKEMNRALQEIDSTNAAYYDNNTDAYITELKKLHEWVGSEIATIPDHQRILITAHDAFGYFGEAYNIEVKGLQGISTLSEYGLRDVSDLVDFISQNKIKAVFVETSVPQRAINAVVEGCKKSGFDVSIGGNLYSDAMGESGTPEGTYVGMVKANVNTIVNALK
ncbi:manganese transporter [Fulvivirga sp. RKSG066]|uniref:metal ABC transporter solute-binding protein, Zn/Mn family n=1 Tax=Fulvivirga aurantia TaxID=2529383 RepID=UPI0012BC3336|nr:zinc ABC transporter substrate-binding protein [Fulvivirga aurantia]MTI21069.1 manganese transporter [Fulvivirga aurantia]